MEFTLKHYAVLTGLAATGFWVTAIVNSVRAGFFSDFGGISFLLVMIANALLYRHVSKSETQIPKNISNFVTIAGFIVVFNFAAGILLFLYEPFCSGELGPSFQVVCTQSYTIYCAIFTVVWLAWTIFGWRRMKTDSLAKTLDEPAAREEADSAAKDAEDV